MEILQPLVRSSDSCNSWGQAEVRNPELQVSPWMAGTSEPSHATSQDALSRRIESGSEAGLNPGPLIQNASVPGFTKLLPSEGFLKRDPM